MTGEQDEPVSYGPSGATRPLLILEAVAKLGPVATARKIIQTTGIPAPTVYRLVSALLEEGFLERSDDRSGFVLGERLAGLADRLGEH